MAQRKKSVPSADTPALLAFLDIGNGAAKAVSNVRKGVVQFEPLIAPMTAKRGIDPKEKPVFSLRHEDATGKAHVTVYGVADVFAFGKRDQRRRFNSMERYTSPDYFDMARVLLRHAFGVYVGSAEYIRPYAVGVNIPVNLYNRPENEVADTIRDTLAGKHEITDYEGCELRIHIDADAISILPESAGAMVHYGFDPTTLDRRDDTSGSTLVIDIGFETTDCSLFEGMRYQRDRGQSFERAGMGIVTRAVTEYVKSQVRDADASRIDVALRSIPQGGLKVGVPKVIEVAPGVFVDVSPAYDSAAAGVASTIAQAISTEYTEGVTRALITGGGAYHLRAMLRDLLPFKLANIPDPENANVIGGLTGLKIKMENAGGRG